MFFIKTKKSRQTLPMFDFRRKKDEPTYKFRVNFSKSLKEPNKTNENK